MLKLTVNTSKTYNVLIGENLLTDIGFTVRNELENSGAKCVIITDSNVDKLYSDKVEISLSRAGYACEKFVIPAGEQSKCFSVLEEILNFLSRAKLSRSDFVLALGGGVVGDITGFAASIYLRGISFVQVPTTLLACVDSSIGGKTAIDLESGKNLVGSFYQPSLVICDVNTLDSLSPHFLADGMAEVIKYGVICDERIFNLLQKNGFNDNREEIIYACLDIKRRIVENDEFDDGLRQLLNFGHTIGHAIEKHSGYSITHGHAVAIGMVMMARACERNGLCETACFERIKSVALQFNLPIKYDISINEICDIVLSDKKRRGNTLTLVIVRNIGECDLENIDIDTLNTFFSGAEEGEYEWMLK